ncbi:MAG: hypothetical protein HN509_16650 [Halobacteriovoraceae bacterium]|nr:hypothetical protein [Halobacteriovoraceae bacterium]MBT5093484.1 hypothetical protein [Halobacteriovoraceae bacterium]
MKNAFLIPWLILALLSSATLFAQDQDKETSKKKEKVVKEIEEDDDLDDDLADLEEETGSDFRFNVDGEVNNYFSSGGDNKYDFRESYVSLSVEWKNKIRGVLTANLAELQKDGKLKFNDDFEIEKFIKEAYIEIREINGWPVAVIVGKQPIAFGQNVQAMPAFKNNPLSNLQEVKEVYGLTLDLTEGLFGLVDQLEVSVFESESGDLGIGKIDGVSVRMSKMLTDQWLLTLSHLEQGNSHLNTGHERRTSVGLIGETKDGMLVGWAEGVYFNNNPEYQDSRFAFTIGAMVKVHETTDVIVEYNWVEKEMHQVALGIKTALHKNVTLGAEIRYNNHIDTGDDEFVFTVGATIHFGTSGRNQNEAYLFGKDGE